MRTKSILFAASLLSLVSLAACSDDAKTTTPPTPPAAQPPAAPPADACPTDGKGTLTVTVTGLPDGVDAKVSITGAATHDVKATQTFEGDPRGAYTFKAERVADADPIVRTVFDPTPPSGDTCLGAKAEITVAYAPIGSSNKLWTGNANPPTADDRNFLGFASASLGATGTPAASVEAKGNAGGAMAFDKDGNMWAIGATVGDPTLVRFAAKDLGTTGAKTADRELNIDFGGCSPATSSLAFSPDGDLYVASPCSNQIVKVAASKLTASGDITLADDDKFTGITGPASVAFDKDGNMIASDNTTAIFRYDAASLAAGQAHTPTLTIHPTTDNAIAIAPDKLAFDADGNLWVTNFVGGSVFKILPADLIGTTTKDVTPPVIVGVANVKSLVEGIAIDDGGGVWLNGAQGKIVRIAPDKLAASGTDVAPSVVLTSADIGSSVGVAFFPAAAGLPIYGRF